ncbi:hypothetical protein B0H14DRAFT_2203508, partial [Mycena olivaceomarginata]
LEPGDVWLILRCLHSILTMKSPKHIIHVHHASFRDFLQDHRRSSILSVGSEQ